MTISVSDETVLVLSAADLENRLCVQLCLHLLFALFRVHRRVASQIVAQL